MVDVRACMCVHAYGQTNVWVRVYAVRNVQCTGQWRRFFLLFFFYLGPMFSVQPHSYAYFLILFTCSIRTDTTIISWGTKHLLK